ncbi:MAG TPA: RNA methyltransferase [Firmicutes bacterium]|uniref:RNA methyltransferase n=1 Tax=Capillibacterium thermochitinicola TaxID=2699427 RepID=A0A8J6I172_9FIRM|nr:RNA methyltransferase [Capillibacterium thermochitinicola]HHW12440.1 RNA methyltransferase [Bacillota bacterium]
MTVLTSRDNPLIKTVISLQRRNGRKKHRLFLAEGPHLLEEALRSSFKVRNVLVKEGTICPGALGELIQAKGVSVTQVSARLFPVLTETETPQDVLAVVEQPPETEGFPAVGKDFCALVLHQLQDPGNLGTIIRTAWAAGLANLFLTPGTVDPYGGKVVRSSQGGIFHLNLYFRPLASILEWACTNGVKVWAGDPRGDKLYFEQDLTGPTIFLLGNEAHGFDWTTIEPDWVVEGVRIPVPGGAESLNVSVSAAILIYEALRQRLTGTG